MLRDWAYEFIFEIIFEKYKKRKFNLKLGWKFKWINISFLNCSDAEIYPDPDVFKPERFILDKETRPSCSFFGFGDGPRMCPGMLA